MRPMLLPAALVLGSALVVAGSPAPSTAGATTCAGRPVTVDLNQAGHPSPDRAASDVVLGTPRGDRFETGDGDDVVCGGDGNDDVNGGAGDDELIGGAGDDRLVTWVGNDVIRGGTGADILVGEGGTDVLRGGDGPDSLVAGWIALDNQGDRSYGDAGNDRIAASDYDELLDGGAGVDEVSYVFTLLDGDTGVTVDLAVSGPQDTGPSGTDELVDVERLDGTDGDDSLLGDAGPNRLLGDAGDDLLDGRGGADRCEGGDGTDVFTACETTDDDPVPSPPCGGRRVTIDLNKPGAPDPNRPASDVVLGTPGADRIETGGGRDVVCGGIGSDDVYGGRGVDTLYGERGADYLEGGAGDDRLLGGKGTPFGTDDTVGYSRSPVGVRVDLRVRTQRTGAGRDTIISVGHVTGSDFGDVLRGRDDGSILAGVDGDDELTGGPGSDVLEGGRDDDLMRGGGGTDYVDTSGSWTDDEGVDLAYGGAGSDQMSNAVPGDRYYGGRGDDDMSVDACFLACDDLPVAMVHLYGGPGAESFEPSTFNEHLDGGRGRDLIDFHYYGSDYDEGVVLDLALTGPQTTGGSGTDVVLGFERARGTGYADRISGGRADESLFGYGGDDTLAGRGGDDLVDGGSGTDTCSGGGGNNEIRSCEGP